MIFLSNKDIAIFPTTGNSGSSPLLTLTIPIITRAIYNPYTIVEKNGILQRVQVKATGCIGKGGNYQVALKSCGGTKGKTYKTVIETGVELIFILTEIREMYLIPKNQIVNSSTLSLCEKYAKFKVFI